MPTSSMIYIFWVVLVFWGTCMSCKAKPSPGPQGAFSKPCNCNGGPPQGPPLGPPQGPGWQGPPSFSSWNVSMTSPNVYWNITVPVVINYNTTAPAAIAPVNPAAGVVPPVALPDGSIIFPNGTVKFPNITVLLTSYTPTAERPVARLPSSTLMFASGVKVAAGTVTTFPAPGVPLNATVEATTDYPAVFLPNSTVVFRNGTILTPGMTALPTVFTKGVIPNCVGVTCHYATG